MIPKSVTEIGGNAFAGTSIKDIIIPETVIKLENVFKECFKLETITFEGKAPDMELDHIDYEDWTFLDIEENNELVTIYYKEQYFRLPGGETGFEPYILRVKTSLADEVFKAQ